MDYYLINEKYTLKNNINKFIKVKTLDKVILVLRGHIRESFKTDDLYNMIKKI